MAERIRLEKTDKKPRGFEKGKSGNPEGRPPGAINKVNRLVKDAILAAMEAEGFDGRGKDGMIGFLRKASRRDITKFLSLVERLLPLQVTGKDGGPMSMTLHTKEEVIARFKERGLPVPASLTDVPTHKAPAASQ